MTLTKSENSALVAALQWHVDHNACFPWSEEPVDVTQDNLSQAPPRNAQAQALPEPKPDQTTTKQPTLPKSQDTHDIEGTAKLRAESEKLAHNADSLETLKQAISEFEGLSIKKTATNLVFADGNPKARIMIIGEAPGADEDRQGLPFVGKSGQLLDKILSYAGLNRNEEDPEKAIYISNILNWRPPGNRTPTPSEIEIALPFIERHIELAQPEILVLCGGISAKTLLKETRGITKLRGKWETYKPQTSTGEPDHEIDALPTFHPSFLLRNPAQKKSVWQDILSLQKRLEKPGT